jgi:iron complex outermembrane receptor protein
MKRVIRFLVVFLFTCVSIPAATPPSMAAASPDPPADSPALMEEVVVTATRSAEEVRNVPAAVTVITEKDIRDSGATSLVEVLEKVEGIQVRSYSGNSPQSIVDLRGFGGTTPSGNLDPPGRAAPEPPGHGLGELVPGSPVQHRARRGGPRREFRPIRRRRGGRRHQHHHEEGNAEDAGLRLRNRRQQRPPRRESGSLRQGGLLLLLHPGENYFSLGYRRHSTLSSQSAGANFRYDASDALSASLGVSFNRSEYELPGNLTRMEMASDRQQAEPARPTY